MANGDDALLTRASVSFHTNDEDKDHDTSVAVTLKLVDGTVIAAIDDPFGHFGDHSDAGPFELIPAATATRGQLKTGNVTLAIRPVGNDTWHTNFFVDMVFDDGAHLFGRAAGLELTQSRPSQSFGLE